LPQGFCRLAGLATFIWRLGGFMLCSNSRGLAPNIESLIVSRVFKGLAAAMMVPQVLTVIQAVFSPKDMGKVIGLFGMISGLGAVAGPLIGGALPSANLAGLEWRLIFLLTVPLGLISLSGAVAWLPKMRAVNRVFPDWVGALMLTVAIFLTTITLVEGWHFGWPFWCFGIVAAAFSLCVAFAKRQPSLSNL
jgi:MFS family permease